MENCRLVWAKRSEPKYEQKEDPAGAACFGHTNTPKDENMNLQKIVA